MAGIPEAKLQLYDKLVAAFPDVERKGVAMPYTSMNGHMFSFLTKAGKLALRLSADNREAFLKKYKTKLCEQNGTVLKEYVEVPDALLKKTAELKKSFSLSCDYVGTLKPKPAKKKKATTKKKTTKKKASVKKKPATKKSVKTKKKKAVKKKRST